MKIKKIFVSIILFALTIIMTLTTSTYAATDSARFGIQLYRKPVSGIQYGYKIPNAIVWDIVKYGTGNQITYDDAIYCLKAGQGFYHATGSSDPVEYTLSHNLKDKTGLNGISGGNPIPEQYYNQILWILDNAYIPDPKIASTNKQSYKEDSSWNKVLEAAFEEAKKEDEHIYGQVTVENTTLTDDDIEVVQQMAIWYFTNANDSTYHTTDAKGPVLPAIYIGDKNVATGITGQFDSFDRYRQLDAEALYKYLINTANANASSYSTSTASPISYTKDANLAARVVGENYVVGPYLIEENANSNLPYDITKTEFTDQNGNTLTYTLSDANGNALASGTTIESLVGKEFYIKIPALNTNVETVNFSFEAKYYITSATYWTVENAESSTQPLVIIERGPETVGGNSTVEIPNITGNYNIELIKVDNSNNELKLAGAKFEITMPDGTKQTVTTGNDGKISIPSIEITEPGTYVYTIKETQAPNTYVKFEDTLTLTVTTKLEGNKYVVESANLDGSANSSLVDNKIVITIKNKQFDLSLRKFITQIGEEKYNRAPIVNTDNLNKVVNGEKVTTAIYEHSKEPLVVKTGDIVIYTIRVYNEGEVDGYASEVTDYLPEELEFVENDDLNLSYGWTHTESGDIDKDGKVRQIRTNWLRKDGELDIASEERPNGTLLKAYDAENKKLDYIDLQVKCKVRSKIEANKKITNIAEITNSTDEKGEKVTDRDSTEDSLTKDNSKPEDKIENDNLPTDEELPGYKDEEIGSGDKYIPGQQDDDDFEKIQLKEFDLSLRKYITGVNGVEVIGREPEVDVSPLVNNTGTTAIYNHPKTPVRVQRGDTITYTIRVYNEGSLDGYASEVTDHLPEELEYIENSKTNQKYGWKKGEDGRTITTNYLSKENGETNLIKAFNGTELDYKDLKVECKLKENAELGKKITNIADITEYTDEEGKEIKDRDNENKVKLPEDEKLPEYKDEEIEKGDKYIPGQEDDDDFEKIITVYFDLSLRKYITGVNETEITNRIPQVSMGENGKLQYEHTKEPVEVENGNIVTYTLRIYNEGMIDGYANKITDYAQEGLEYLPENETNKEYRWVMYRELEEGETAKEEDIQTYGDKKYVKTENSEEAKIMVTDYLSKEQEKEAGANLIKAFDKEKEISEEEPLNPDYRDIKIAFKVTEPNTSDRILENTAEITDDRDETNNPVEDIDSTPGNDNEWNEEDDLDKDFVKVKYFDLALKKWVSKAIIIEDGKETIQETGHTGDENPEPIVKVDLHRKELNKVTVKFEYQIKVTNEGEIAGYAKEVTDYVPEGLKFVQEDNKQWYTRDGNDRKVGTRALENTLLQPGESATVSILLTWINGEDNVGVKTNIAEISEDYNDSNTPDIDSVPDNEKKGEDDIDDAPVMLAIATGQERIYYVLGGTILAIMLSGVMLIKKYVL